MLCLQLGGSLWLEVSFRLGDSLWLEVGFGLVAYGWLGQRALILIGKRMPEIYG
jgi:hypothetical protein